MASNSTGNEHKCEPNLFNSDYEAFYFQNISSPPFHRALSHHFRQLGNGQQPNIGALAEYSREIRQHVQMRHRQPKYSSTDSRSITTNSNMLHTPPHSQRIRIPDSLAYSNQNPHRLTANNMHGHRSANSSSSSCFDIDRDVNRLIENNATLDYLLQNALIEKFLCHSNGAQYLHCMLKVKHNLNALITNIVHNADSISLHSLFTNTCSQPVMRLCVSNGEAKNVHNMLSCLLRQIQDKHESVLLLVKHSKFAQQITSKLDQQSLVQFTQLLAAEMASEGIIRHLLNNDVCKLLIHLIEANRLAYKHMEFLANALESELPLFCNHIYCCRVIQTFLRVYGTKLNVYKLFENNGFVHVSISKYGNYVIMRLIEPKQEESGSSGSASLFADFRCMFVDRVFSVANLWTMSESKYGSNVVEMCIRVASPQQIAHLTMLLVANKAELLKKLLNDKYAHFVAKTLLRECVANAYNVCLSNLMHAVGYLTADNKCVYGGLFVEQCRRLSASALASSSK